MTDAPLDLDAIQARLNAATDGPWYLQPNHGPNFVAAEVRGYERGVGDLDFGTGEDADADRDFVLHAHRDVEQLLARVRQLEAELAEAHAATETNREISRVLLTELAAHRKTTA